MKRRFLALLAIGVLFSTLFSVSSANLNSPKGARAAGCTTTSGSFPTVVPPINNGGTVKVASNPGDTVSATWPGPITITPVVGGNVVMFGLAVTNLPSLSYTITVCPAGFTGGTGGQVTTTNFTDGRLNSHDPWETSAIYCMGDGSVRVYVIGTPWFISFTASPAEIAKFAKHPSHNTVIKVGPGASLSRQSNGLLLVTSPGLNLKDGDYHFTFSDCGILIGL